MRQFYKLAGILFVLILNVACQSGVNFQELNNSRQSGSSLSICSALDFSQVTWSGPLSAFRKQSFEVALNISGSFEGASGWANLSNNFDGQGLSMGLLNQNLGQGSLQPLLLEVESHYPSVLQNIFSPAHLQSLLTMLDQWTSDSNNVSMASEGISVLSILDQSDPGSLRPHTTATDNSVTWAVNNLYSGTDFIPQWQSELTALGQSPQFVSIQVEAAMTLHQQTLTYMAPIKVNELRAYLMVFDIIVQDGGIYTQDFTDYATWLGQNPRSTTSEMLVEMLNLRLRHVQSQYVADVQSRKMAIINGSGVVHGGFRSLQRQYCYNGLVPYQN